MTTSWTLKHWLVKSQNKDFLWANNQESVANIEQKFTQKIKEILSTSIEGSKAIAFDKPNQIRIAIGWFPLHPQFYNC